ncbi:MAG: hypothetical protein Q4E12_05730, partial [Coriobacteriia bacterium]|nr:hypothetical protein [Coriobacteriia bacterium]
MREQSLPFGSKATRVALSVVLAAGMCPIASYSTAIAAEAETAAADASGYVTCASYRAAEPAPEILGLSNVATNTAWQKVGDLDWSAPYYYIFGSQEYNSNANPYMVNAVANVGKDASDPDYATPTMVYDNTRQGGPTASIGTYEVSKVVWDQLPDVILGNNRGYDYNSADYSIAAAEANGVDYQVYGGGSGANNGSVIYDSTNIYTMIQGMYDLAEAGNLAAKQTGKQLRYGDATAIAKQYEAFILGTEGYVLKQLSNDSASKKTVALISNYDSSAKTYTLVATGVAEGTAASNRYLESVQAVANNLGDEKTTVTADDLNGVDLILVGSQAGSEVLSDTETIVGSLTEEQQAKTFYVNSQNGSAGSCYGVVMNSVENAQNFARIMPCLYPEYLDQSDMIAYYYQTFYHLNTNKLADCIANAMDGVRNWNATGSEALSWNESDVADYNEAAVEGKLAEGLAFVANNQGTDAVPAYVATINDDIDYAVDMAIEAANATSTSAVYIDTAVKAAKAATTPEEKANAIAGINSAIAVYNGDSAKPYWTAPTQAATPDDNLLRTYGVRAGSAGADFMGLTNTNFDFSTDTSPVTYQGVQYTGYTQASLATVKGAALSVWATSVNQSPNPYYQNLYYNAVMGTHAQQATTWVDNPETSSWGDSNNATSQIYQGNDTIAGMEYGPDVIFGANKYTNWNLDSTGANSGTNFYAYVEGHLGYNPTFTNNDATNVWTQIYTMGQLAQTANSLTENSSKYTRYNNSDSTVAAVQYEKAIRGQLLYLASQVDSGDLAKKTIAYLYAIDDQGVAYFFTPTAEGLTRGDDTGADQTTADNAGTNYAANNSTINMGYMATLPFVSNTFDSGNATTITMKVEDIFKANPACTVSAQDGTDALANVDLIIYNSSVASSLIGTSGGRNSSGIEKAYSLNDENVTAFASALGFTGRVQAGDDFGTSSNQGVGSKATTASGQAPYLYCARNYTADKDVRAVWGFAAAYPELYGDNPDATYAYWVNNIYHVNTADVPAVVKYMENKSSDVTYDDSVAAKVEANAAAGLAWWNDKGSKDNYWSAFAYYNGSSRASYYAGLEHGGTSPEAVAAEEPADTIGIFAPSALWTADTAIDISDGTRVTIPDQGYQFYTGSEITPYSGSINKVVVDGSRTRIYEGTDYTVAYENNTKTGTATATITGMGSYKGTVTMTFEIVEYTFQLKVNGDLPGKTFTRAQL